MFSISARTLNLRGIEFANISENKVLANISESKVLSAQRDETKFNLIRVMRRPVWGFPTRFNTNQAAQSQKMVREIMD